MKFEDEHNEVLEGLVATFPTTPLPIMEVMLTIASDLYIAHYFLPDDPPSDPLGRARHLDRKDAIERRSTDEGRYYFVSALCDAFRRFLGQIKISSQPSIFVISLSDIVTFNAIDFLTYPFRKRHLDFFSELRTQLAQNYEQAPKDFRELVRDTPFEKLLSVQVPFEFPRHIWPEHTAIFAPSGHGKTRLLENLIVNFLKSDNPPALFIMDSMGAMLKKIERLQIIPPEKLIVLDPTDQKPPALNFFKLSGGSKAQQTALFFYLFKAIDQGLTQRQATMVAYLVEWMQVIPGATLDTLRQVCESKVPDPRNAEYLDQLDPIAQDFFRFQFFSKDALVNQTKQQIAQRLYTIGRNHTFNLMFNAPDNRFDAFEAMQSGKVVLVNTDRYNLGDEASAIFGRYIIAQCLAAALARAPLAERQRHLALLVIDEAKQYLDEQAELILSDARQFGLGLILATQVPHQLTEGIQRELATNTSTKMLGPVDYSVASRLARDMHTTPDFIMSMSKRDFEYTEFATYVRGLTPQAMKLRIPMNTLTNEPMITDAEHQARRERNRELYGASPPAKTHEAPTEAEASHDLYVSPARADVPQVSHKEVKPQPKQTPPKTPAPPPPERGDIELDKDH